ncbi:MAG: LPXTG cell wall anchor domain-containing protein [Ilumatobacteraceae bacterium]
MKVQQMKRWMAGGAFGAVMLVGGHAAATDYPPGDTTVTTVAVGGVSGLVSPSAAAAPAAVPAVDSQLAATGSDSDATLKLAGGALVAGAGLLVAAKLRRRPAEA